MSDLGAAYGKRVTLPHPLTPEDEAMLRAMLDEALTAVETVYLPAPEPTWADTLDVHARLVEVTKPQRLDGGS